MNWTERTTSIFVVLGSTVFTLMLVNLLFNALIPNSASQAFFPRALVHGLGKHNQTYYPEINNGKMHDWVAVLGDSYAAGQGDGFINKVRNYSIWHHRHQRTGENYYSLARPGYGSLSAVREYFLFMRELDKCVFCPAAKKPKKIILVFYEGNDLDNNLIHYRAEGNNRPVGEFVASEIEKSPGFKRWWQFYFPVINVLGNVDVGILLGIEKRRISQDSGSSPVNTVMVGDRGLTYSVPIQAASPELSERELSTGLDVFYRSVDYLMAKAGGIPVEIIYIPSIATSYRWKGLLQYQAYHSKKDGLVSSERNNRRSAIIRHEIANYAKSKDADFVDTTPFVMERARTHFLHGTHDPMHFNVGGYELVSEIVH